MNFRTLIRRSLRYHWRSHLGVVLGAAIGSAALIGALVVGDSVRESLREQAVQRLGQTQISLTSGDRLFQSDLANRLASFYEIHAHEQRASSQETTGPEVISPILQLSGTATSATEESRANRVRVLGVDARFWKLAARSPALTSLVADQVVLNEPLAKQLRVKVGDALLLRIAKPEALSQETTVASRADRAVAIRARVAAIVSDAEFGGFDLQAGSGSPFNAMLSLAQLQNLVGETNRANVLLAAPAMRLERRAFFRIRDLWQSIFHDQTALYRVGQVSSAQALATLYQLLAEQWALDDAQLELKQAPTQKEIDLRTRRIFLDEAISAAVWGKARTGMSPLHEGPVRFKRQLVVDPDAKGILTYLATLLRDGTNATPYSMVTAAGPPWTPADMRDDEILVSQWLADDLNVKPGDEIAMSYFLPESGAKLTEATNTFRVRSIVPMEMPWADRTLMPDFPGIEKAESTSDWDAGFPLTYKVRPKDDDYWKQHRGTPKAFITLAAGQKMWGNRFGNLTAIRFPIPTNATTALTPALSPGERENRSQSQSQPKTDDNSARSRTPGDTQTLSPLPGGEGQGEGGRQTNFAEAYRAELERRILSNLKPEELGLRFEPVREQALKAAAESQDFGGLFLGFSFFVIIAALLLMAMLFQFGLEQRAPEIGTLLALGFTPKQVRRLLLREGVALAFLGGIIGTVGGLAYARAMIHGLTTIWRDAVGASALSFHFTAQTLVIGLFASVVVSAVTIWLSLRKFVKRPARELLVGETQDEGKKSRSRGNLIGAVALICAVGTVGWTFWSGETNNAESFFSAGSLVLVAGLAFAGATLTRMAVGHGLQKHAGVGFSLVTLAIRGCARRRKRSLATVAMLACGSFLILSIGVFRLDANRDATLRNSGTGGFALMGETTMPVVQDLNTSSGRDFFALNERDLEGVSFVPFRVRAGDEASCLNLNAAQRPRLLGVKPEMLEGRFSIAKGEGWASLRGYADGSVAEIKPETSQPRSDERSHEISAIGDVNSIQWAMHKKVGDTIDYVDERGQPFKVRIVGAVANSILQGQLIIDEAEFVKRFPGESGYRMFLIDAPSNTVSQVSASLSRAMQDVGLELTPAAQRLDQFNAVQNTYLGTFQVLGGLGLLLGSVGLGIVVLRNVLERRGELALLMAVGFRKRQVQRLILIENAALLTAGLALGVVAAAVAVLPALLSPGAQLPIASLALTLGAVLINGAAWTWGATRLAVRGDLLAALRSE